MRLDDRPIELGPRKQRAVLAMLALEVGRTVSADRLVDGLWGEEPPPSAPKMVQLYVSHLRRCSTATARGSSPAAAATSCSSPTTRSTRCASSGCWTSRAPREALALWRGDALADVADEPFAAAEIRRLDELRLRATESAIDADLAAGRHAEVIGELEALVAAEPLRERLHAQRMLALYRSGRQSEALAAYRDARAALVEQIGVEPGAELRAAPGGDPRARTPRSTSRGAGRGAPAGARPPPRRPECAAGRRGLLLVAGVTAYGVIRVLAPDGLAGIGENAVGVIDPESGRITERYGVGSSPSAVVDGGGSVWVANAADGTVSRIDREPDRSADDDPRSAARRPRSRSAAARSGSPTATPARWCRSTRPRTGSCHRWRSATPRARSP